MNDQDIVHLHQAYELAKLRRGFCSPNPSVGAVIVKNNKILATGYHQGAGSPHAEPDALKKLNNSAQGATLYVTLEPCCHFGRTPPCTNAIIKAGIQRVVYGFHDPNPLVAGKGEAQLKAAGITCDYLPLPEITHFYESYHYWQTTKKPFITAKIALSLDGKIAGKSGEPIQITGEALKEFTHYSRQNSDAILTTAKTIIQDDPRLNVRTEDEVIAKPLYILDTALTLQTTAKIFKTAKSVTIFYTDDKNHDSERLEALAAEGATCVAMKSNQHGLDLNQVISHIGQDGIHDLWIEAGGKCFSAFLREKLLKKAYIYIAPKWIGEGQMAFLPEFNLDLQSQPLTWQQVGEDVMCEVCW